MYHPDQGLLNSCEQKWGAHHKKSHHDGHHSSISKVFPHGTSWLAHSQSSSRLDKFRAMMGPCMTLNYLWLLNICQISTVPYSILHLNQMASEASRISRISPVPESLWSNWVWQSFETKHHRGKHDHEPKKSVTSSQQERPSGGFHSHGDTPLSLDGLPSGNLT